MKKLFIRSELCTGCKTCVLACAVAHSRSQNLLGAMMESPPPHTRIYVEAVPTSLFEILKQPMACRHCDPAPCIAACIPQAMHRGPRDEVTNVGGKHACIACGMCIMTCPFGMIGRAAVPDDLAPSGARVMAVKCDLCPDRPIPACVEACPTGAIIFTTGDDFSHETRQRASAVLATARQIREATLVQAQEESLRVGQGG